MRFAGSAANPESSGEFATGRPFIRKGKTKIKITYLGLYCGNVSLFFVFLFCSNINCNDQLVVSEELLFTLLF